MGLHHKSLKLSKTTTTKIQNDKKNFCCMNESKAEIQEKMNIN